MTIKDIEDRYERALQAALMLDLANPLGLPVLNIDPRAVATICRSADDVSKLLDVAKALQEWLHALNPDSERQRLLDALDALEQAQ